MRKSDIKRMPPYFDRYIDLAEDVPLLEALELSLHELYSVPILKWKQIDDKVYAPGKWTLKDILQHFIDTERVFVYRITAIARGDKQKLNPYDEAEFAKNTAAHHRTLEDLLDELILVRRGTIAMFKSFTADMLHQKGNGVKGMYYCPLSLGFMLAGHQRWHFNTIQQKYYPLIEV